MSSWAATELLSANFGDARLTRRLIGLTTALAAHPTASVPEACGNSAATKAAYRFWDHDAVTPEAIHAAHQQALLGRLAGVSCLLAIQDTTALDFTAHPATRDLGSLHPSTRHGMWVHSVLLAVPDGAPVGVIDQQVWARDPARVGISKQRRQRATAEKESQRWLDAQAATLDRLPAAVRVVTVADREADIFDLFAAPRRPGADLLVRAAHDRALAASATRLWATIRAVPAWGSATVTLRRGDDRPPRDAVLTLRAMTTTLLPPRHHPQRATLTPVTVAVVLAREEAPPPEATPVTWLLLTTVPVVTLTDAITAVRWYTQRWLIERWHFVLKSGCAIERLQLETAARLARAVATYSVVAWRLLWLTYQGRATPDAPCTVALDEAEWQALWCHTHRTPLPPATAPPLGAAVRWIARLGGHQGRKGDGAPGVQTIWRGLRHLEDLTAMYLLLRTPVRLMGNA